MAGLALLLGAGCGGGGSGGGGGGGPAPGTNLAGTLSVFLPDPTTQEAEPNDTISQAHFLGDIGPGDQLSVVGTIMETGADTIDVFEFRAPSRLLIDLELQGISTQADLDVFVIDPVGLQPVQRYITMSSSESGTFAAQGTFFVLVDAFSQDSDYELRLAGRALLGAIAESEPNDQARDGDYLGTLEPGDEIDVAGAGVSASSDFFLFAAPSGSEFTFDLLASGGDDFDVYVYDVTTDIVNPVLLASFETSGAQETGTVMFASMTTFALEVRPFGGADDPYSLVITSASFDVAPVQGGLSLAPRASLDTARELARGDDVLARASAPSAEVMRGDIIVQLARDEDGALTGDAKVASAAIDALGGDLIAEVPQGPKKVRFPVPVALDDRGAARYSLALAASLRGRAGVVYAEQDLRLQHFAAPAPQSGTRPNDPNYNLQWHYEQIQLPAAWDVTTGNANVRIAVLDTGGVVANDLSNLKGIDMISDPAIAGDGDGIDNDPTDVGDGGGPQPSSFHGAHVAGTIAALTNNGYGVSGVMWSADIEHVRVLGIGGGSSFDIANGVLWAAGLPNMSNQVANPPVDIMNLSLGGPGFSQTFQDAVTAAHNAGSLVIAAAGNENSSVPSYPAAYANVTSVAAVDFERRRAPYSNFHATVDIAAPGGDVSVDRNNDGYGDGVLSTKPNDTVTPTNFENFAFYQGTSMAAPHVAGVAGLVLSVDPTLTPDQVATILRNTATDLGDPGRDDEFGEGLVNALAAVQSAGGGGGMAPVLALGTQSTLFDSATGSQRIGVQNVGGGALQVTNVTVSTMSGGNWLSAVPIATGQAGSTDTSSIEVVVDGASLANGSYTGTVTVTSNGGTASLLVTLLLGAPTSTVNYEVFIIAVDAQTYESEAQDELFTNGPLAYALGGLEAGEYVIVAGTDEDGDGFICDEGEPLCGLYPSLELADIVTLNSAGDQITNLDFPLQQGGLSAASAHAGGTGYRLLQPRSQEVAR